MSEIEKAHAEAAPDVCDADGRIIRGDDWIACPGCQRCHPSAAPTKAPGPEEMDRARGNLRHLYKQMIGGHVHDTAAAARGLLGPAIEILETLSGSSSATPAPTPHQWQDRPGLDRQCAACEAWDTGDNGSCPGAPPEAQAAPVEHDCACASRMREGGYMLECDCSIAEREMLAAQAAPAPADWLKPGARVDYHAVIGGPVTQAGLVVTAIGVIGSGRKVAWLAGKSGCVALESLTLASAPPRETSDG